MNDAKNIEDAILQMLQILSPDHDVDLIIQDSIEKAFRVLSLDYDKLEEKLKTISLCTDKDDECGLCKIRKNYFILFIKIMKKMKEPVAVEFLAWFKAFKEDIEEAEKIFVHKNQPNN